MGETGEGAPMLSKQEAYAAMFAFLEHRFNLTKSDELGALLGSMSLLPDGMTSDPALWGDWCAAVEKAKLGAVRLGLELK